MANSIGIKYKINPKVQMEPVLALLAIGSAICFLFLFGFLGLMREGSYGFDFHVFHEAGQMLLNGQDFWRITANAESPYSYPPHSSAFIFVFGSLPFNLALTIHTALNLAAIGSFVYLANHWFLKIHDVWHLNLPQGLGVAVIIGNPFVAHSFFMGQLTIIAASGLLLSWHFFQVRRWWLSGLFLGIATIKPQLSFLYVLWLLVNGQFRIVFFGAIAAFFMMIPALAVFGPVEPFSSWLTSLIGYAGNTDNNIGATHVFGLENAINSLGFGGPALKTLILGLGLACFITMYHHRLKLDPTSIISFLIVLSLLFIYAHDYDLASLGIMFSFLIILATARFGLAGALASTLLLVVLFVPQRFVRDLDPAILSHWRVFIVPICAYLILCLDRRIVGRPFELKPQKHLAS